MVIKLKGDVIAKKHIVIHAIQVDHSNASSSQKTISFEKKVNQAINAWSNRQKHFL